MQLSNIPGKLVLPFANAGGKSTIPVASQIGITAGAASLTDGFPPLTRTPIAAGGVPPSGLDMNGILYEMSAIIRWANAGGGYPYDGTFATDTNVGGYPKGARIMRSDGTGYWFNTVENNVTDPEGAGAAAAGWVPDYQSGATSVAMSGSSVTLTPNQYGKPLVVITGTLSANLNLIFPPLAQGWTVINNATGGYSVTAKTASGSGVTLGTISQIVGDGTNMYAANPDSVQIVNNVATLRNIAPSLSRRIQTCGYYTKGDGAASQYFGRVGAAPGTYVHNGGTVIVPNGGDGSSAWFLDISATASVTVKQFGAYGNNTNATVTTSAINAAIAAFPNQGTPNWQPWNLIFPNGTYATNGAVNVKNQQFGRIIGYAATINANFNGVALQIGDTSGTNDVLFFNIEGLQVVQNNTGLSALAVQAQHLYSCAIRSCYFYGGQYALNLDGNNNLIENVTMRGGITANAITAGGGNNEINTFRSCAFEANAGYGIDLQVNAGVGGFTAIEGCYFEANAGGNVRAKNTSMFRIVGNYFNMDCGADGVILDGTTNPNYRTGYGTIAENRIAGPSSGSAKFIHELSSTSINCTYRNNQVESNSANVSMYGYAPNSINEDGDKRNPFIANADYFNITVPNSYPDYWTLSGGGGATSRVTQFAIYGAGMAISIPASTYIYQQINVPANALLKVTVFARISGPSSVASLQLWSIGLGGQYVAGSTTSTTGDTITVYLNSTQRSSATGFLLLLRNSGAGDSAQFCDIFIEDLTN